jgi:crossover junction endodeoxyribonuclease RuvC
VGKLQKFLGIDPGLTGAWATWDGADLKIYEVPTAKAKGRGKIVLWDELSTSIQPTLDSSVAYIEQVGTRPGEGGASAFKFGYIAGGFRGILAQASVETKFVTPQKWKKHYKLGADKKDSVKLASFLFPVDSKIFYGPRGGLKDGCAEAALIALYAYIMEKGNGH